MGNTNTEWISLSDKAIVLAIGEYIKHHRLNQNKTQAQVAKDAGVNRWTISKVENGDPMSLLSLIQILRALDLLPVLEIFKVETQLSPIAIAKLEQKKRQRARTSSDHKSENKNEW